jgi:hypothetical protein
MSISIDIDLDDVYYQMGSYDKQEMMRWLAEDGYVDHKEVVAWPEAANSTEADLLQAIKAVWDNRLVLDNNDIAILNRIANKTAYEGIVSPGHGAC